MFGVAVVQLNFLVETSLASLLTTGAVSALNYAWRVMLVPQAVVAQSVATAAFPTFADQYSRGQLPQLRSSLSATVRSIFFIAIPAGLACWCSANRSFSWFFSAAALPKPRPHWLPQR